MAPSSPSHVWVGTGSAPIRSNVIIGRGVFKSTDAGKTFEFMGLKDSGQIWPRKDAAEGDRRDQGRIH